MIKRSYTIFSFAVILVGLLLFHQDAISQVYPAYVVVFTDKPHYEQYIPSSFLSPRAIANRERHHIPIIKEDYPVDTSYIATVLRQDTNIRLLTQSKWMNYIVISCDSSSLKNVGLLPFVKDISSLHVVNYQELLSDNTFHEVVPRKISIQQSTSWFLVDTDRKSTRLNSSH